MTDERERVVEIITWCLVHPSQRPGAIDKHNAGLILDMLTAEGFAIVSAEDAAMLERIRAGTHVVVNRRELVSCGMGHLMIAAAQEERQS